MAFFWPLLNTGLFYVTSGGRRCHQSWSSWRLRPYQTLLATSPSRLLDLEGHGRISRGWKRAIQRQFFYFRHQHAFKLFHVSVLLGPELARPPGHGQPLYGQRVYRVQQDRLFKGPHLRPLLRRNQRRRGLLTLLTRMFWQPWPSPGRRWYVHDLLHGSLVAYSLHPTGMWSRFPLRMLPQDLRKTMDRT